MLATHHLEFVENCHRRSHRTPRRNDDIRSEVVGRLAEFVIPFYHPKGATLFAEGQPSRGVFILHSGRIKLFTHSANGRTLILRFADPGEMLGLAGAMSGQPYETWAEAIEPTRTNFVDRRHLTQLMQNRCALAVQVAGDAPAVRIREKGIDSMEGL
jgi:CRP-like cAMP-binding protein